MDWTPTIGDRSGPLYLRIVAALADDIAAGKLHHGQALPTHRTLATTLGIDLTTVTRAYTEARRQGLTEAFVGRGTFVKAGAAIARQVVSPGIDLSMNIPPQPAAADLGGRLAKAIGEFRATGRLESQLNYQQPGGTRSERGIAAEWLQPLVPHVTAERLVIAPGTQSVLLVFLLLHAVQSRRVLTEALTYPGLKAAAGSLGVEPIGVEMDAQGIVPQALERACDAHPEVRIAYLMPTMHNPSTITLPLKRRQKIARIIAERGLLLIEDDPYAFLTQGITPITTMIPERSYLAASLSKSITPGLRASLVVAPSEEHAAQLTNGLRASLQMSVPLALAVVVRWLREGTADAIIKAVCAEAAARQEIAAQVLRGHAYAADRNGHHLWLTLPSTLPRASFAAHLHRRGLGVVTADAFATTEAPANAIRIALGAAPNRATLAKGLEILRHSLHEGDIEAHVV